MQIITKTITEKDYKMRLDKWLMRNFSGFSFIIAAKLLRTGQVRVNGKRSKISYVLEIGDEVRVPNISMKSNVVRHDKSQPTASQQSKIKELAGSIPIIYQDASIIVINKPQGIATQAGSKNNISVDRIAEYWSTAEEVPRLVHRLDKETSGVLVMARTYQAARDLTQLFRKREIVKRYLAIVLGVPDKSSGIIKVPISKMQQYDSKERMSVDKFSSNQAKFSITEYKVLDTILDKMALVEFIPITGRTHQIRIHSQILGCPILGDKKYGQRNLDVPNVSENKLHLHAWKISIPGYNSEFIADIPSYFAENIHLFGLRI